MQAPSAERHQRPVTAHRRAGVSHPAAERRFTQRWTRRPRRGEFAGGGDLGHNKPPRPHSLQLYTRDCTGRDPVTARGVEQATCRVIVVRHVLGCKYDVAGQQCRNGTTMALEETPGRCDPELSADFGHAADLQVEPDNAINLPHRSTGSAQLPVVGQATGRAPRTFRYAPFQPWFDLAPCRYRSAGMRALMAAVRYRCTAVMGGWQRPGRQAVWPRAARMSYG